MRILQTSDLHGNLLGDGITPTTVLQLASVVRQASAEAEGGRAILIDTGDTIQGSLASRLSNGEAMAVFSTVIPVFALSAAIRQLGAGRTSLYGMVGPMLTIGFGWWLLDEQISMPQLAGAALGARRRIALA